MKEVGNKVPPRATFLHKLLLLPPFDLLLVSFSISVHPLLLHLSPILSLPLSSHCSVLSLLPSLQHLQVYSPRVIPPFISPLPNRLRAPSLFYAPRVRMTARSFVHSPVAGVAMVTSDEHARIPLRSLSFSLRFCQINTDFLCEWKKKGRGEERR